MIFTARLMVVAILCAGALGANQPKLVKLDPPKLCPETISEKIVCTRPMREGKFNISLENCDGKTVINCYGHGGSGWTTLFGSVNRAIELFKETQPSLDRPIRIIGSGCMGLTTAIELTRLGYKVVGISTKSLYDMPSWRAAGYFALVSIKTSPEEEATLNEIGKSTFLAYRQIDEGKHAYITQDAVKYMPVYCSADTESGVEELEAQGLIPSREYVSLDFGNDVIHHGYVKYMTYFMNTTTLMQQLTREVANLDIEIKLEEIKAFDQISEGIIFNCSGLGGRELNADDKMIPVRGHLVTLNDNAGLGHMDYMIYTKVEQEGQERYIYMFPKNGSITPENPEGVACMGVLGGTFIPHVDLLPPSEQEKLDSLEFKRMLDRNSQFFQGHPFED